MAMARRAGGAREGAGQEPGQGRGGAPGRVPPSELRDALQLIHVGLLFNERFGMDANSALVHTRKAGDQPAPRAGGGHAHGPRRGGPGVSRARPCPPRPAQRRCPAPHIRRRAPTRESLLAEERAWQEYFAARDARLAAIREAARPTEANTAGSLPAWVP